MSEAGRSGVVIRPKQHCFMENTYADPEAGEPITACYIPELKKLAMDVAEKLKPAGEARAISIETRGESAKITP